MSFNSIINKYNKQSNKSKVLPLKRDIKSTALYSNEMVRDFIKIANCRTVRDCNILALESLNNIRALEFLIRQNNTDYRNRRIRISKMKKYSVEAANVLYSMEEENKSENWFKKTLNWFREMFKKVGSWIASTVKKLLMKLGIIKKTVSENIYKNFKPEDFQNMEAEVLVLPYDDPDDILQLINETNSEYKKIKDGLETKTSIFNQVFTDIKNTDILDATTLEERLNEGFKQIADMGIMDRQYEGKDVNEILTTFVYSMLFDSPEKPKRVKMKVGDYLKCKAGEKPKALEVISPNAIESLKNVEKDSKEIIKLVNVVLVEIDALLKKQQEVSVLKGIQQSMIELINKAKNHCATCLNFINLMISICTEVQMDIGNAIKAGMTKK